MVFPGQNLPLPHRPFPFDPSAQMLPKCIPDCHLVRTVIPCLPSYDSLGVFHYRMILLLASFASMVSRSDNSRGLATTIRLFVLFPRMFTQGRLHCTQHAILRTALQVLTRLVRDGPLLWDLTIVAQYQVSTETGSYTPCHWSAPWILNPQHPP